MVIYEKQIAETQQLTAISMTHVLRLFFIPISHFQDITPLMKQVSADPFWKEIIGDVDAFARLLIQGIGKFGSASFSTNLQNIL